MNYASTTAYLVALRSWFHRERMARMQGKEFNEPMPTQGACHD
jgi:hypothetical protein